LRAAGGGTAADTFMIGCVIREVGTPVTLRLTHGSLLLLKGEPDRVRVPGTTEIPGQGQRRRRIRCPRCAWEPGRHDLWMCVCLHSWNTFDTRGVCPACGRKWAETQCLRCTQWSPHDDWYEDERESSA
jgi:hypothetical protein